MWPETPSSHWARFLYYRHTAEAGRLHTSYVLTYPEQKIQSPSENYETTPFSVLEIFK